jgi:hypothetical protein
MDESHKKINRKVNFHPDRAYQKCTITGFLLLKKTGIKWKARGLYQLEKFDPTAECIQRKGWIFFANRVTSIEVDSCHLVSGDTILRLSGRSGYRQRPTGLRWNRINRSRLTS